MPTELLCSKFRIFLIICTLLGYCSPKKSVGFYKVYCVLLSVMFIGGYIHSTIGKLEEFRQNSVLQLTDQISSFLLTVTCSVITTVNVFIRPGRLPKLATEISKYDSRFSKRWDRMTRVFWISLTSANVCVITVVIMDCYIWITIRGLDLYRYFVIRNAQYYKLVVTVSLAFWITTEITSRFENLNNVLKKLFTKKTDNCIVFTVTSNENIIKKLRCISKLHYKLCDIVDQTNAIFGAFILFHTLGYISHTIHFCITLIYIVFIADADRFDGFKSELIVSCCIWLFGGFVSISRGYLKKLISNFPRMPNIQLFRFWANNLPGDSRTKNMEEWSWDSCWYFHTFGPRIRQ